MVTRLTLRTRELPAFFGGVFGTIKAVSDAAYRELLARVIGFYRDRLFNRHWGEQIGFQPDNSVRFSLVFQGLTRDEAREVWRPFLEAVAARPGDYVWETPVDIVDLPARKLWDAAYLTQNAPQAIVRDDRPGAPEGNILWANDASQVGHFLHAYRSAWLPASLLEEERQGALAKALFAASRHWGVSLHCNKGLAGAPRKVAAARDTAMNPAVLDAFALAIIASEQRSCVPRTFLDTSRTSRARRKADAVHRYNERALEDRARGGSYVSGSDFFERKWQSSYWGRIIRDWPP